jgi:hypothetical protein
MAAAGLEPTSQHPYWQANGGVTYQDPDGREVVFVSWVYGQPDRTESYELGRSLRGDSWQPGRLPLVP